MYFTKKNLGSVDLRYVDKQAQTNGVKSKCDYLNVKVV